MCKELVLRLGVVLDDELVAQDEVRRVNPKHAAKRRENMRTDQLRHRSINRWEHIELLIRSWVVTVPILCPSERLVAHDMQQLFS